MSAEYVSQLQTALTPKMTKYIPHVPTPKQTAFLLLDCEEAFYGGAAGGGKSDALLMAALQFVDIPGYNAILFRRTFQDLALPEALMTRAKEWLFPYRPSGEVHWNAQEHIFTFRESGATLSFGYLEHVDDRLRYQGAAYHFVGFDELTQMHEQCYTYLFSRNRRLITQMMIPLRFRSASNPGGPGHEWVKKRFVVGVDTNTKDKVFIPAMLRDNPYIDQESYTKQLWKLTAVEREQLLNGNWSVRTTGSLFSRDWFDIVPLTSLPTDVYLNKMRWWDLAGTKPKKKNPDPDWTVGLNMIEHGGVFWIPSVIRFRKTAFTVKTTVKETAQFDGYDTNIWMEQGPGDAGKFLVEYYAKEVLKSYMFQYETSSGDKETRAKPVSIAAEQGRIKLIEGAWNNAYLDELEVFPFGVHDDQVDSTSGAYNKLARPIGTEEVPSVVGEGQSYWQGANA